MLILLQWFFNTISSNYMYQYFYILNQIYILLNIKLLYNKPFLRILLCARTFFLINCVTQKSNDLCWEINNHSFHFHHTFVIHECVLNHVMMCTVLILQASFGLKPYNHQTVQYYWCVMVRVYQYYY